MSAPSKRKDAGHAVAGLFGRASSTGGLATREARPLEPQPEASLASSPDASEAAAKAARQARRNSRSAERGAGETRVRLGVELTEAESAFLRALSRPARTGEARTLGSKFVAAGVLAAAIELLEQAAIDMRGVGAGDHDEMTARARHALIRAAQRKGESR
jgi:hypothetical protein